MSGKNGVSQLGHSPDTVHVFGATCDFCLACLIHNDASCKSSAVDRALLAINCSCLTVQIMFVILHIEKGTPFETPDQAKFRYLTVWEQMDYGVQFSASRKFLTIVPIVL